MKEILNKVISSLNTRKNGYCQITHKRGWLDYLRDGDLVFSPQQLHGVLRRVIDSDKGKPRGAKLFHLRRSLSFTMMSDQKPYRTEEALERFIIASNTGDFYNQIPIGGGKESIDLGIKEDESTFTFVELKPWESHNSPLYALLESLKNLLEYRIILEREIKEIPRFQDIKLVVLAPDQYYQRYDLTSLQNIAVMERTVGELSLEFQAGISFMALEIEKSSFLDSCRRLYEGRGLSGQVTVTISNAESIPGLARKKWQLIIG